MDVAKFLEAPIRSNPRRESQPSLLSTLLPPTPREATSPASQSASPSSSFSVADAISRSEFDFTPADSVHPVSSATRSQWPTELGTPEQQTAEEPHQKLESEQSDDATKPKRIIKAACSACRKRKAKTDLGLSFLKQCDGKRPSCTSCITKRRSCQYSAEEGVSSQMVTKRRLEGYGVVLQLVRDAEPEERELILQDLRRPGDLGEIVMAIQKKWTSRHKSEDLVTF
ncbi:hypothetical protein M438DRAFT_29007 [Aureobasidium pullulans EXF-150]|uniref:Zn(2)-C6 fungal-type domain-containing protein n=1 Tax=Aureobasidium pullulans EXF-150 TaxID=1043002 RepID=A0A074XF93_AURPU|nr:uncharacterized protein M438DRAFT_29007 [Aureobasidium pullulans EXF-150]KEQ84140.1 hypothetical protein M438DRAFT_29007 [Aureobasidium pullulans EXF-150]